MPSTVHVDANRVWGGGQVQSLGLALALSARGEETRFIAQSGSALASRLSATCLPWETMALRGVSGLAAMPRLVRRFREIDPDIVHVHDSASHAVVGLAARAAERPRVVVTRRTEFPLRRGWLGTAKYHLWCDRIICISEAARRRCLEAGLPEERLVVIPDFVDCQWFDPDSAGHDQTSGGPTIVTVGRLTRGKGHRVLLRALRQVAQEIPGARLMIYGEGEEGETLRREAETLGVAKAVTFAGFVPDVRQALAGADVFVTASTSEGRGVAVLEAMAMAKAVVATNVGGLSESVAHEKTGLLVPARDATALAEALVAVLKSPARAREMGEAGRERALTEFDRPRVVQRIAALYADVIGEGTA